MRRTKTNGMRRTKTNGKSKKLSRTPAARIPEIDEMKELIFAQEYLTDLDPVGAALRTGLISMRLSLEDQEEQAHRIFNRPTVQQHIRKAIKDRMATMSITEDKVLRELSNLAFFNMADLTDQHGDFKDIHSMPRSVSCAIQEMEYKVLYAKKNGERIPTGHITKVKLHDKLSSLKTLLTHMAGKLEDRPNINYNQFNIGNQVNSNNTTNNNTVQQIDMSDFTDLELQVLRKLSGDQDPLEIIELQQLESRYYESEPA